MSLHQQHIYHIQSTSIITKFHNHEHNLLLKPFSVSNTVSLATGKAFSLESLPLTIPKLCPAQSNSKKLAGSTKIVSTRGHSFNEASAQHTVEFNILKYLSD